MRRSTIIFVISVILCLCGLSVLVIWPQIDLAVSSVFADPSSGFYLDDNPVLQGMTKVVFYGARALFFVFLVAGLVSFFRKKDVAGLSSRAWAFLFFALLLGPGLMANVVFKDNWGRARPRTVKLFGGTQEFTRAGVISHACARNCSFVSGDAAFGFFLPSLAYVVPLRRKRRVFWSMMGVGVVFSFARIALGAHFLSDVAFAFVLVTIVSAFLHMLMFKKEQTTLCWKTWLS